MVRKNGSEDTICALATPPGKGGISVVRVSGPQALQIVSRAFVFSRAPESHRIYFGNFLNASGVVLDEVLVSFFQEGKSFTGEETLEISCHGSPFVVDQIIQSLLFFGCRLANRGEFSFRAFMNGRLDLVQAESVLSIIESQSKQAHQAAMRQLKGGLSKKIKEIQTEIQFCLAHIEANIDFSLENLETMPQEDIAQRLLITINLVRNLIDTYAAGKIISDSLHVVLIGAPNAGKSSLFNALLEEERAIVTPIEGTTRDVLSNSKEFKGVHVRFIDTAGVRTTDNLVEQIGIKKAKQELESADLIFYVYDLSCPGKFDLEILQKHKSKIVLVGNKLDLLENNGSASRAEMSNEIKTIFVSAHQKNSLKALWNEIEKALSITHIDLSAVVLKQRQHELLCTTYNNLFKAHEILSENTSSEFAATELRVALSASYELLGEQFDDQVLSKIFQEFCIGK